MQSLPELLRLRPRRPTVSVVRLQGAIGTGGARALTDAGLAPVLEAAFRGKPVAVALQINSPGGSPVQSSVIAARIRRLAEEKRVPVVAFAPATGVLEQAYADMHAGKIIGRAVVVP